GPRPQAAVQEPAPPAGRCLGRRLLRRPVRLRRLRRTRGLWPQEGRLFPALPRTPRGHPLARHLSAGLPGRLSAGVATLLAPPAPGGAAGGPPGGGGGGPPPWAGPPAGPCAPPPARGGAPR